MLLQVSLAREGVRVLYKWGSTLLNNSRSNFLTLYYSLLDTTVGELYNKYKGEDGFLYVEFAELDTYGWWFWNSLGAVISHIFLPIIWAVISFCELISELGWMDNLFNIWKYWHTIGEVISDFFFWYLSIVRIAWYWYVYKTHLRLYVSCIIFFAP